MKVSLCDSAEGAGHIVHQWEELAGQTAESNAFYEPALLLPALRYLNQGNACIVLVWRGSDLIGFFPVEWRRKWRGMPHRHLAFWYYRHCYLTTPLIHRNYEAEALEAFMTWTASMQNSFKILEFDFVSGDGPFFKNLTGMLTGKRERRVLHITSDYERAVFNVGGDFDSFCSALNGRRNLKKKSAHLARLGSLQSEHLHDLGDNQDWCSEFLLLEKRGWKGSHGTAMAGCSSDEGFFRDALAEAGRKGSVLRQKLCVGGEPIAMKCTFLSGTNAFCFKIAYDERYKEYSPGLLLEFENARYLLGGQQKVTWMDSCAAPDAPLFARIWHDRRRIVSACLVPRMVEKAWRLRNSMLSRPARQLQEQDKDVS